MYLYKNYQHLGNICEYEDQDGSRPQAYSGVSVDSKWFRSRIPREFLIALRKLWQTAWDKDLHFFPRWFLHPGLGGIPRGRSVIFGSNPSESLLRMLWDYNLLPHSEQWINNKQNWQQNPMSEGWHMAWNLASLVGITHWHYVHKLNGYQ